jgi:hypothetical protein
MAAPRRATKSGVVPAETVDIDGPTPPPSTSAPLPKAAEPTAPAETSDPFR